MLTHLLIQNFTIIDELELEFSAGMTALTGETGAGKSILLDALSLVLGGRAESNFIRNGSDRCDISASFQVSAKSAAATWLMEYDLVDELIDTLSVSTDHHEHECVLRRVITREGKSRASINGKPVPVQSLRELGILLVNIHGQHEHQLLAKHDTQRELLDVYGENEPLLYQLNDSYLAWRAACDELTTLHDSLGVVKEEERVRRSDWLRHQLRELETLSVTEKECADLEIEHRQLSHVSELMIQGQAALQRLAEDDANNISSDLTAVQVTIATMKETDRTLADIHAMLDTAAIQVKEAAVELRHYLDRLALSPERLAFVDERLALIHDIARKHRVLPAQLPAVQLQLEEDLQRLENSDAMLLALKEKCAALVLEYQKIAEQLSKRRRKAALQLNEQIIKSMQSLGMTGGRFSVDFIAYPDDNPRAQGQERVEFQVSANPGQPLQALHKVASGGELSRISLAIQVIVAQRDATPTLIFDEVDAGVGGATAAVVGQLLRALGESTQVLCVTHLPQVASKAHHHFQISKAVDKKSTHVQVSALKPAAKVQEIARMLGGLQVTKQTVAHAKEMLENT